MIDSNLSHKWVELKKREVICGLSKGNWMIRDVVGLVSN